MAPAPAAASASRRTTARIEHVEDAVLLEQVQQRAWRINGERLAFAQHQQSGHRIDVAADQDDSRRSANRATRARRPQARRLQNLLAQIGRRADHDPVGSVAADGDARLGRGPHPGIARPRQTRTDGTRSSTAGTRHPPPHREPGHVSPVARSTIRECRRRARLHLAGEIAVDLHADADLAELRTRPGHGMSPRFLWLAENPLRRQRLSRSRRRRRRYQVAAGLRPGRSRACISAAERPLTCCREGRPGSEHEQANRHICCCAAGCCWRRSRSALSRRAPPRRRRPSRTPGRHSAAQIFNGRAVQDGSRDPGDRCTLSRGGCGAGPDRHAQPAAAGRRPPHSSASRL